MIIAAAVLVAIGAALLIMSFFKEFELAEGRLIFWSIFFILLGGVALAAWFVFEMGLASWNI